MKQWRILHSEASLGWGGQEMRVLTELVWMRAQGHMVYLLAPPKSTIALKAEQAKITVVPLQSSRAFLPLGAVTVAIWMLRHQINIVCTHSSLDGWIAGLAARLIFIRLLIRYRHIEIDYPNKFWSRVAFRLLPHFVITTSQRIADRLHTELQVPKSKLHCIATGVDLNKFRSDLPDILHEELKLPATTQLVGIVSVLRSWKGHQILLEAWKILMEAHPELVGTTHLVIAGDGPGRDELAKRVSENPYAKHISLIGHRSDVPSVLASLSIVVLPSTSHEGIPQIILQAQAMGRAIIASDIGGIPEAITHDKTGYLVPPNNPHALSDALNLLLKSPDLRERLGDASRLTIVENHSLDAMGIQILNHYQELYEKRRWF